MPKLDHTEGLAKSSGWVKLRMPTTMTPANSMRHAAIAMRWVTRLPMTKQTVATM